MAQFVGGRYQLIAQLGGGGMADVYLAKMIGKSDFAKLAVVKRLKTHDAEEPEVAKMFADEARLSARLNHPNIVQTFEVGEDTEGPYLVMEYLEGQPLSRLRSRCRRRGKPFPRAVGLHILRESLTALSYAHQLCDHDGEPLRVVHRDVSPENILVTYAGTTKLVDFGVAKTATSSTRTRAGVLKGKIAYMAPEQARSDTTIDARADVFAAGLIFWEILTGKRMWEGMTELDVVARLVDAQPLPTLRSVDPEIPEELDRIAAKALAKDRDERFATSADFLEELEAAQRKLDLQGTAREVSQLVSGLFEDEREKMKKVVATAVTRASGASGESNGESLPRLANRASQTSDLVDAESDPNLWTALGGSLPTPSTPSVTSLASTSNATETSTPATAGPKRPSEPPVLPEKGKGKMLVALAAGAAVIAIAGFALTRNGGDKAAEPQAKESPPPTVTAPANTAPATTTASPPAPEVTIEITAKPAAARIFVDGKRAPGNPHRITSARGETTHEVRAEADGYEPRSMTVAFDRDRELDLSLVAKAAPNVPVVAARPVAPKVATPSTATGTATATAAPPAPPPPATTTARTISEIDPSKGSTQPKQDKIDKDVFKR